MEEYLPCKNRNEDGRCLATSPKRIWIGNDNILSNRICSYHNPKNCPIFNFHETLKAKEVKQKENDDEQ